MKMRKISVMLVDDEKEFVEYMSKRLIKRGYRVDVANSGEEALEKIPQHEVDVVVLDILMPGMGGSETLLEIKKQFPHVEVIMLTGHGTIESAVKGLKKGAFDYLLKPCEFDDLTQAIEKAFEQKEAQIDDELDEKFHMAILSPREALKDHED